MKKSLWVLSIMLALAITLTGCATTRDLEKMQAQENQINAKADQALQDAKAAAAKADAATTRAETAVKVSEDRAQQAEAIFTKSMKK